MAHFMLETEWVLTAPVERVFDLLADPAGFSDWWPAVKNSQLVEAGDAKGLGTRASYTIRSPMFYRMDFEVQNIEVDPPYLIKGLVRGDAVGTSTHLFERGDHTTTVKLLWYVSTTKRWMNVLAPVVKPLFVWAYRSVMRDGCAAMAKYLGARLVSTSTNLVAKGFPHRGGAGASVPAASAEE